MNHVLEFISTHAALLVALMAVVIALRASHIAKLAYHLNVQNKSDADRVLLAEKKRSLMNELDKQHATLARLSFITAGEMLQFQQCPKLNELLPDELDRLKSNLNTIEVLENGYDPQRALAESLEPGREISEIENQIAKVRQLSIHLEKDIIHEQSLLGNLRHLVKTAPDA